MTPAHFKVVHLLQQGRNDVAEHVARELLSKNMEDALAWVYLGQALMGQQKLAAAEEAARKAVSCDPDSDGGYYLLAGILLERDQDKDALVAARDAIRQDPEDSLNYAIAARALNELSRYEEAVEMAQAGLAQDGGCDSCLFHLSQARSFLGHHKEADEVTKMLLEDDPEDATNHTARGYHLLLAGRPIEARQHFLEALRLNPLNGDARYGLAQALTNRNPLLRFALKITLLFERWGWKAIVGGFVILMLVAQLPTWTKEMPGATLPVSLIIAATALTGTLLLGYRSLSSLLLLTHRETRLVVTADERKAALWCLPFFAMQGYLLFNWFHTGVVTGALTRMPDHLFAWALLPSLVWEVFDSRQYPVRWKMAGLVALCSGVMVYTTVQQRIRAQAFLKQVITMKDTNPAATREERAAKLMAVITPVLEHRQKSRRLDLAVMLVCLFGSNIRTFLEGRTADPD